MIRGVSPVVVFVMLEHVGRRRSWKNQFEVQSQASRTVEEDLAAYGTPGSVALSLVNVGLFPAEFPRRSRSCTVRPVNMKLTVFVLNPLCLPA